MGSSVRELPGTGQAYSRYLISVCGKEELRVLRPSSGAFRVALQWRSSNRVLAGWC